MSDGGDWGSERMEATYAEARAVLDAQNATMGDIDSKSMRTVRFNVLLVGVLITAARFAGPSVFNFGLLYLSIGSFVASAVLGIVTYNESDLFVGPQGSYVERLAHGGPTDSRWDRDLLETFGGMISENADDIDWNSGLLTVTQGTLIVGIVSAVLAHLFKRGRPILLYERRRPRECQEERTPERKGPPYPLAPSRARGRRGRVTTVFSPLSPPRSRKSASSSSRSLPRC